jgi:5-hydroxyisourate hydrolase
MKSPMDRRAVLNAASLAAAGVVLGGSEAEAQTTGGQMTVHILDIFSGTPAHGVKVDLFKKQSEQMVLLKSVMTDTDGRPESGPVLSGDEFSLGRYLITFDLSDYFKSVDRALPANFFRKVSMEFEVTDQEMPLHIPLQCTPWTQACSVLPGG